MTSYLLLRKKVTHDVLTIFSMHKNIYNRLYRWAARYDSTNTHSIKIVLGRLAHGKFLPSDEASGSGDFTVSSTYFTQFDWAQWQNYEKRKGRQFLSLCMVPPITKRWYSYLVNIQGTALVGNSSYQAGKPVTVSVRGIVQLENEIWFLIIKNINSWC